MQVDTWPSSICRASFTASLDLRLRQAFFGNLTMPLIRLICDLHTGEGQSEIVTQRACFFTNFWSSRRGPDTRLRRMLPYAQTPGTCASSIGFCSVLLVSLQTLAAFLRGRSVGRLAALVVTFRSSARPIAVKRERRSTPKAFVWQQPAQGPNRCIGQPWLRTRIDNEI